MGDKWIRVEHADDGDDRIWLRMPLGEALLVALGLIILGAWLS